MIHYNWKTHKLTIPLGISKLFCWEKYEKIYILKKKGGGPVGGAKGLLKTKYGLCKQWCMQQYPSDWVRKYRAPHKSVCFRYHLERHEAINIWHLRLCNLGQHTIPLPKAHQLTLEQHCKNCRLANSFSVPECSSSPSSLRSCKNICHIAPTWRPISAYPWQVLF